MCKGQTEIIGRTVPLDQDKEILLLCEKYAEKYANALHKQSNSKFEPFKSIRKYAVGEQAPPPVRYVRRVPRSVIAGTQNPDHGAKECVTEA